jgi:glutathione S-transferase
VSQKLATPVRLITIPISHYCEKTRWALARLKIPFIEERHMPPFHRFATRQIGKRSNMGIEMERQLSPINRFVSQRVGGQSVPVLLTETDIFTDSAKILDYLDTIATNEDKLYPIELEDRQKVDDLVRLFDTELAPAVRLWTYFYVMDYPQLVRSLWCQGVPWYERLFFPIVFRWMRSNVVQMYGIDRGSANTANQKICDIFNTVDLLLADGRNYLVGDRFSAADLAFATLAAAVVLPTGYGIILPELSQFPSEMAEQIQLWQSTLAGKFVLQLYRAHIDRVFECQ